MNTTDLTNSLLAGLLELEQSGDLVITHPAPSTLADQLCSRVVRQWAKEFLEAPPNEVVIADGIKSSSRHLRETFNVAESEALSTVETFVHNLPASRTPSEIADLIAHQGAQEIALGAYYCVYLRRGEYYSSGYLDWRRDHYAQKRSA